MPTVLCSERGLETFSTHPIFAAFLLTEKDDIHLDFEFQVQKKKNWIVKGYVMDLVYVFPDY